LAGPIIAEESTDCVRNYYGNAERRVRRERDREIGRRVGLFIGATLSGLSAIGSRNTSKDDEGNGMSDEGVQGKKTRASSRTARRGRHVA
jgi:hypothetical protein